MDFKIKTLELKKDYLNHKVRKYNGLVSLYNDYIEFLKEDTTNKINKKVLGEQEKLFANFQKVYVDLASEQEIFDFTFNAKYVELKKKKRLEFRAFREKTNRKIKKLSAKEGNEALIEELKKEISSYEVLKAKEVEVIANKWKEEFKAELSQKESKNPALDEVETLKLEIEENLKKYRSSITEQLNSKLNNKIIKINKKIEKISSKLVTGKEKLNETLEIYNLRVVDNLKIEQSKSIQDYEKRIAKANDQLKALNDKLSLDPNNESVKNDIDKNENLIKILNDEFSVLKSSLEQTEVLLYDDEILKVNDLCMYFGGIKAVNNLSFSVKKNEIFGLIGPNGAGKTTVFNCITQFYKPTKGTILFRNKNNEIVNLIHEKVHNVILQGIVRTFQNLEVIKDITVLDNLLIAAHRNYTSNIFQHMLHTPLLNVEEKVITKRALEVLEFMGLTKYKDMYAWGLPYGILKKIEIARTLMCNPQLIILDEPAAGLNDSETVELTEIIRKIRDKYDSTILLVEHDMGLVMNVCDRICAISFGNLLGLGTPSEIQQNKAVQEAYLGASED